MWQKLPSFIGPHISAACSPIELIVFFLSYLIKSYLIFLPITLHCTALYCPQDIGSPQLLKEYESRRYYSNLSMMSIVDTINTAFSIGKRDHMQPSSPQSQSSSSEGVEKLLLFLRSAGMLGINSMGSLKGRIAKIAMGLQNKETNAKG